MTTRSIGSKTQALVFSVLLVAFGAAAQIPGQGPAGMTAALTKLFGDIKAFSSKAHVRIVDGSGSEIASMPMDFALLDEKVRIEMDLTQAKNQNMPPGAADSLKQMGMAHVVSIIRPDKKSAYVVYPDTKVMMSMPLPKDETDNSPKMAKTPEGKETLEGHACTKNKWTITDQSGKAMDALTWNASDLKDFPIQIRVQDKQNTSTIRFQDVKLARPDAKDFEAPTGYTEFNSPQELMQGVMKKLMEQPAKK